jgi:hypothetical protein
MSLIVKYEQFLEQVSGNPFDFRIRKDVKLFQNFNESISQAIEPLGTNKAGCIVCIWKEKKSMQEGPVIWLDSEGEPNCVFADSIQDFFLLLPYGTGHLYDIIVACERFMVDPATFPSPEILFSGSYASLLQKIENDKELKNATDLYKEIMELTIEETPARIISGAYRKHFSITQKIKESKL